VDAPLFHSGESQSSAITAVIPIIAVARIKPPATIKTRLSAAAAESAASGEAPAVLLEHQPVRGPLLIVVEGRIKRPQRVQDVLDPRTAVSQRPFALLKAVDHARRSPAAIAGPADIAACLIPDCGYEGAPAGFLGRGDAQLRVEKFEPPLDAILPAVARPRTASIIAPSIILAIELPVWPVRPIIGGRLILRVGGQRARTGLSHARLQGGGHDGRQAYS
jgi:hypothetical protein